MKPTLLFVTLLLLSAFATASELEELAEGQRIVENNIACDQLSNDELEAVGEYLMELMHPGELHDLMHQRMGITEGTPEHDQVHINMAQMMYCGNGMMGYRSWMMGYRGGITQNYGMMGRNGWTTGPMGAWGTDSTNFLSIFFLIGLVLIVWLIVVKLALDLFGKKKR